MGTEIKNEEEMLILGEQLGTHLIPGDVLVLTGELGAGKTTLTKGIAKGLGIEQMIKSPTYTIVREYAKGRLPLYHMDVYRLTDGEGEGFGLEEYYFQDGVVIMEWGNNLLSELPEQYLEVILQYGKNGEGRVIDLLGHGDKSVLRVADLKKILNIH